jgi:hypothetical protein
VRTSKAQLVPATENGTTTTALSRRLRYGPGAPSGGRPRACHSNTRRLRTLLLVVTITIPLLLVGIVAVLWHLAY